MAFSVLVFSGEIILSFIFGEIRIKMKIVFLVFLFLSFAQISVAQYYPEAGRIKSYTENASFSASPGNNLEFISDNNINTYWISEDILPEKYIANFDYNCIYIVVNQNITESNANVFDGNLNTKSEISKREIDGKYRFLIPFRTPTQILLSSMKLSVSDTVKVFIETVNRFQFLFNILPSENFKIQTMKLNDYKEIIGISMVSNAPFDVFEIAAMDSYPEVYVEADFGSVLPIGQVYVRNMSGENVIKSSIQISSDRKTWETVANLQPKAISMVPVVLESEVQSQYLRLVHTLNLSDYGKSMIWELKVYDKYGPFGKSEQMALNNKTMRDRIGINGFWGWGFNTYSDNIPIGQGSEKYFKMGNLARSYHNMIWDITKPGESAGYETMKTKGTTAKDWLDWGREYADWKDAGFTIDASIQFQQSTITDSMWKNPFNDSFKYGFEFGSYFGNKTKLIDIVEVGNEPWDYQDELYNRILLGIVSGIKASKSNMQVFPAAFQATFRPNENLESNNYIGSKLDASTLKMIDGINGHFYSHTFNENGMRISVNPENPRSELLGVRNLSNFRNVNLPGKPLIITEFGYDSNGGGEDCDHLECVTENQQAAWGLRAALLLLRNNADIVYWYFFANENRNSVLHSRSGLCSSANTSFQEKISFKVFAEFQEIVGNCILKEVLNEDQQYYSYLFENQTDGSKYIVMWSIKNNDPLVKTNIKYTFPSEPIRINYLDDEKYWIDFTSYNRTQSLSVNGFPSIIQLK